MASQASIANEAASSACTSNPIRDEVQDGLRDMRNAAKSIYQRSKEQAQVLERKFEDGIRERPVRSVLVAAGIGAGVGLLLGIVLARR